MWQFSVRDNGIGIDAHTLTVSSLYFNGCTAGTAIPVPASVSLSARR